MIGPEARKVDNVQEQIQMEQEFDGETDKSEKVETERQV